jgi:hypothetical protein
MYRNSSGLKDNSVNRKKTLIEVHKTPLSYLTLLWPSNDVQKRSDATCVVMWGIKYFACLQSLNYGQDPDPELVSDP